jgi:NodT family efflux transporter outer membrane factor (OMF) lipoprotein
MRLSSRFIGQEALGARPAARQAELSRWWDGFGDPMLSRLVTLALEQNLDLAQASARVSQSRAALQHAGAALLPSGQVGASAAKSHLSLETPVGRLLNATPNFDRNGEFFQADLGASWEIDLFGGLRRNREAALAEYQAAQAGTAAVRLAVAAQTADIYVTVRGLQQRIAVAREQTSTRRKLLEIVQVQFERGLAAELQVRQAEGALAQVAATLPQLETGLDAAMNALDVLLGSRPGTYRAELATAAALPTAPSVRDTGSPAELIRRRPDLIVAERRLAASNARIGAAAAEYYPKLTLSGLLGSATTASGGLFGSGANQAQAALGLRWRLFDFGRVDAEIAAARGANAQALAAYRLAVLRATQDVEDALSALVKREDQARTLATGQTALARAQQLSRAAYANGVVSLIEVLNADAGYLQTRDARVQAETESLRAAISTFRALGGGWEPADPAPRSAALTAAR